VWKLDSATDVGSGALPGFTATSGAPGGENVGLQQLRCMSSSPVALAANDKFIVGVLGRLRPYGKDYGLEAPAQWLLEIVSRTRESFYDGLAGFFALVVLDKQSGEVRLISDHVGSVPFYVYRQGERLWLTDSLKQLESSVAPTVLPLNPQAIYNYCFQHCIPAPDTIYVGVRKLEPGAELRINLEGEQLSRTLHQPEYQYSADTGEDLKVQCRQVIEDAVRRNVAPGSAAFLSGGLDSSTVAGLFAAEQPGAPTFSIGFEAEGYDETEYARLSAQHFGTTHHEHYLQPTEIVENFTDVAGYFDEPFGNSSAMAAYVCAKVASEHQVTVMLAGDGGDEIFGGNERYAKQKLFEAWSKVPKGLGSAISAVLETRLGAVPVFSKGRSYIEQATVPLPDRMDSWNLLNRFGPDFMFEESFLGQVDTGAPAQAKRDRYNQCVSADPVERMMYLDWKFTLADNDLMKVSRMCHKAGVEVRYPLFEKEVVDFSCTVPSGVKLPGGKLRDFYKKSFRGFLPDATLAKEKHGFGLPFGVWMKEQPALQQLTRAALDRLRERGIFRADFIDTALQAHQSGHSSYYGELIWIMVVLELWLESRGR
tara:strand:- start:6772 stop:8556 length:1785 start_codon:yes stop_codon:yes gene_type:complete